MGQSVLERQAGQVGAGWMLGRDWGGWQGSDFLVRAGGSCGKILTGQRWVLVLETPPLPSLAE